MSKIKRAVKRVKDNLLSDSIKNIETKVNEISHSNSILHHEVAQIRQKTDQNRSYGSYQMSETEVVAQLFNGLKIIVDPRDIAVAPHLILDGIWEDAITKAWLAVQKSQSVVFDIGANFGYFGLLAAQKVGRRNSKVVLFEANPELIPYIKKTFALNWFNQNSIIENQGVSEKTGKSKLTVLRDYVGSSSLQSAEKLDSYLHDVMSVETKDTVSIKTVTIDEYCKQQNIKKIDLIKMDIEGYEEKAYAGMQNIVKNSPNLIMFIEFTKEGYDHPQHFYEKLVNDFGFIYTVDESNGKVVSQQGKTYDEAVGVNESWTMLVLAKQEIQI